MVRMSAGLLLLSFVFVQGIFAHDCKRALSKATKLKRSIESIQFWKAIGEKPPATFDELSEQFKPQFINGLPTYESRPDDMGFTDWAFAFARAHPLDSRLINAARWIGQEAKNEFHHLMRRIETTQGQLVENNGMELAMRSQYYSEMRQALAGEIMPFPEQEDEAVEAFFKRKSGGTYLDLYEAHVRLYHYETELMNLDTSLVENTSEVARLQHGISFYKKIIERIPDKAKARLKKATLNAN
jgi:hypothetical protein